MTEFNPAVAKARCIMAIATTERPRDAINVRGHDTERLVSMQLQSTISLFGDPRLPPHFWSKVHALNNGCWEWQAGKTEGYGRFHFSHREAVYAHRFAYERLVGPIPEGLTIDHLCRNRACVIPGHMEPVTNSVNVLRGVGPPARNARKTHCPRGHPYDSINTRYGGNGDRYCRACDVGRPRSGGAEHRARLARILSPERSKEGE